MMMIVRITSNLADLMSGTQDRTSNVSFEVLNDESEHDESSSKISVSDQSDIRLTAEYTQKTVHNLTY